jgi:hypothetical protein
MNTSAAIAAALLFASGPATAAELKIVDIKAFLYFEHAGKLSDNIVGAQPFENVAKGGGADHDPATAILFDLTFAGDRRAGSVLDQEDFVLNSVGAEDEIREGLVRDDLAGAAGLGHADGCGRVFGRCVLVAVR